MAGIRNLVLAPHPDDAELGNLGWLGQDDVVMLMSDGAVGGENRLSEMSAAAFRFRFTLYICPESFPDGSMNPSIAMVREIEHALDTFKPKRLLTPPALDAHQDHRAVAEAAVSASRRSLVSLYEYESPSALPSWAPDTYVPVAGSDLSDAICNLRLAHSSQALAPYFKADFLESRARFRGMAVGVPLALAFRTVRQTL